MAIWGVVAFVLGATECKPILCTYRVSSPRQVQNDPYFSERHLAHRLLASETSPKAVTATLVDLKGKVRLRVSNSSNKDACLETFGKEIKGCLEAYDGKNWKSLENFPDCGYTGRRSVLLAKGYGWTFDNQVPTGNWKTKVRWTGWANNKVLVSNTIEIKLPLLLKQQRDYGIYEVEIVSRKTKQ